MDTRDPSNRIGLLIALGGAILLFNLIIGHSFFRDIITAAFMALCGLAFLSVHRTEPEHWWTLIPGLALLGLAVAAIGGDLGGATFLGAIGLAFALIYRADNEHWWAIIPAGALFTLAVIAAGGIIPFLGDSGALLFLGLAATFGVVWRQAGQPWAIWPMGALLFMSLLILGSALFALTSILLPILLIGGGLWLLFGRTDHASA